MSTKGVVLCGGEGKRLKPLTDYFQKTMIPIGPRRRPLLEYVVRLLAWHKVREITLLTGYRSEQIENYFGDGSRFEAKIAYSHDTQATSGSANALSNAIDSGKLGEFDNLLVYYGDILSDLNITDLLKLHRSKDAGVTLVLSRNYTLPVGVAKVENGLVKSFKEKPSMELSVTTGCMVITRKALRSLRKLRGRADLMTHFIPETVDANERVAAYYVDGFWYDVGTTEAYERLDGRWIDTHLRFLG
jgi:mannose-1-phosphate guanylyltransferase